MAISNLTIELDYSQIWLSKCVQSFSFWCIIPKMARVFMVLSIHKTTVLLITVGYSYFLQSKSTAVNLCFT